MNLIVQEYDSTSLNSAFPDKINKIVKECDILVGLFAFRIGSYTLEEYKMALEENKLKGIPLIYTYFKRAGILTQTSEAK